MPQFTPKAFSDPSNLTHGRHPAFLLAVLEEDIPDAFIEMKKKDTHMYRWHLCIWEHPDHMQQYAPEQQSGISSRAFSPKGKFQASKAYVWTSALIGRELPRGQGFDIDPLLPLACWVDIERIPGNDFCKVIALHARPEGQAAIPPVVHQLRAQYATGFPQGQGNGQAQAPQQQAPPPPAPPATSQQWGQPGPAASPGWPGPQAPAPQAQPPVHQPPQQPQLPGTRPAGTGGVPF